MGLVKRVLSGLGSRPYCLNQMIETPPPPHKCPSCQNETLVDGVVDNYETEIGDFVVIVPDIERSRCSSCGEECYGMDEATRVFDRLREGRKAGVKHRS
jgi:YgiT-type zinc finger domain-containing protein